MFHCQEGARREREIADDDDDGEVSNASFELARGARRSAHATMAPWMLDARGDGEGAAVDGVLHAVARAAATTRLEHATRTAAAARAAAAAATDEPTAELHAVAISGGKRDADARRVAVLGAVLGIYSRDDGRGAGANYAAVGSHQKKQKRLGRCSFWARNHRMSMPAGAFEGTELTRSLARVSEDGGTRVSARL